MARVIINDPIHDVMDFGNKPNFKKILKSIIDTDSFQRLRRISQLGLASYVFPGATHGRFSHSLGAAYLSTLVLKKLSEQDEEVEKEAGENFSSVVVSALLHDIGHGPFSHSFEHVLENLNRDNKEETLKNFPLHENWTAEIICNHKTEINKAIINNGLDPELIASPFKNNPTIKYSPYLKQIISSQIDVDRMDYLLRDSHFSGVAVGKFDLNYLINCLQVIAPSNGPKTLGLYYKGIRPYEAYLISRHLMNRSVYYHRKVKTAEFMAESIFKYLINKEMDCPGSNQFLPDYLKIVAKNFKNPKIFDLESFLNESVNAYIDLTEDDFWFNVKKLANETGSTKEHVFAKRLLRRDIFKSLVIQNGKEELCNEIFTNANLIEGDDFKIIESKSTMYKQETGLGPVLVKYSSGSIKEISSISTLIQSLSDRAESEKILIVLNKEEKILELVKKNDLCIF